MSHPYRLLPERNFWKEAVSQHSWVNVFEAERGRFSVSPSDRLATAGSCFAQRISQFLTVAGYNFVEYEGPHNLLSSEYANRLGYGRFSARYGNIYTPRQLKQLVDEAFEKIQYEPRIGVTKKGAYIDLRRPNINNIGFISESEARADREYHLTCVRKMFLDCDVFIFTMGLTESWVSRSDGLVYGTHPEVALGRQWGESVDRVNFDYIDCFNDMVYVINFLQSINRRIRFIFTVSPVALAATHQDNHVLLATSYSKSVLRAVAGRLVQLCPAADYFCSFELFSAAQSFGQFLSEDLRDVSGRGVDVAMQLFRKMFMQAPAVEPSEPEENSRTGRAPNLGMSSPYDFSKSSADVECDEVMNAMFGSKEKSSP